MIGERILRNEISKIRAGVDSETPGNGAIALRHESGVYRQDRRVARAIQTPHAFDDAFDNTLDEDDSDTSVYHPKPVPIIAPPDARAPTQRSRTSPVWKVGMLLSGSDLTQLWLHNAATLEGKTFVWAEHAQSWVTMQPPPGLNAGVALPQMTTSVEEPSVEEPGFEAPIDLTSQARLLTPWTAISDKRWLAVSIIGVATIAALVTRLTQDSNVTSVGLVGASAAMNPQQLTNTAFTTPSTVEIPHGISVEALPLVGSPKAEHAQNKRDRAASIATPAIAAKPFDATIARRAMAVATGALGHCASGEVSGAVYVTLDPSGRATQVRFDSIAGDRSRLGCVTRTYYGVRVAPFQGNSVVVKKRFQIGSNANSLRVAGPTGPNRRVG